MATPWDALNELLQDARIIGDGQVRGPFSIFLLATLHYGSWRNAYRTCCSTVATAAPRAVTRSSIPVYARC